MQSLSTNVIEQVSTALSAASFEHQVIASNIANRDAVGYQRMKVRFDAAMSEPRIDADNTEVSLEQDVLALSTNTGRYEALTRSLSRYFSIVSAITAYNRG